MPLKDFAEFLEPLTPVYRGIAYPLPPVGVKDAIPLMQSLDPADEFFLAEEEFERILLGDQADRMRVDNVPAAFIRHAFTCAIVDFSRGREAAEARYEQGPDLPKAPAPAEATSPEDSQPSTRTGEANATPSPASGTGTTNSRPSSARKPKSANPSSGTRSSSSGRSSKRPSTPSSASTS